MKAAVVLAVVTLSVAGPRRVLQGWQTRRAALEAGLSDEKPGAAAFQRVWRAEDAAALASAAGLPHAARDEKLGLALASREPIMESESADLGWGAGALRARVGGADLWTASLSDGEGEAAEARRLAQLTRLAELVRARTSGPWVVLGELGASPDEHEPRLFLDLLGARDLCVAHGDEVCGRTRGDVRVDYILVPYAPRPPESARAAFTASLAPADEDGAAPPPARFGLAARLDARWLKARPAASPEGRAEALEEAAGRLGAARAAAEAEARRPFPRPWLGAADVLAAREEALRLGAAEELARSALARAAR